MPNPVWYDLDEFTQGYIECLMWSETDELTEDGGKSINDHYTIEDFSDEAWVEMTKDCKDFCTKHFVLLEDSGLTLEEAGHDFALTRNGHGTGFWDRGLGEVGDQLSDACKPYGTQGLYVGDDGQIYAHG